VRLQQWEAASRLQQPQHLAGAPQAALLRPAVNCLCNQNIHVVVSCVVRPCGYVGAMHCLVFRAEVSSHGVITQKTTIKILVTLKTFDLTLPY
jgi:hypothetical protein